MNGVKRTIIIIFIILILLIYAVLTQNPILIAVNLSIISFLFGIIFIWIGLETRKEIDFSGYTDAIGKVTSINTEDNGYVVLSIEVKDANGIIYNGTSQHFIKFNNYYHEGDNVKIKYRISENKFMGKNFVNIIVTDDSIGEPIKPATSWISIVFGLFWIIMPILVLINKQI